MKSPRASLRRSIPSLHSLMLFEASARLLNFSKAAEELSVTQPAISHGIRQLEAALGHPLFVRERRALSLTSNGQRLYASVSMGLISIAETIDEIIAGPKRDTVVVCASTALATEWLLPTLPELRNDLPNVAVEIRCLDRDPDLSAAGIDVHLRLGDGQWQRCEMVQLWPEAILALCSPAYQASRQRIETVDDIRDHELIHYVDPYRLRLGWSEWLRLAGATKPNTQTGLLVNDSLLALAAAERGQGLALGWRPVIDNAIAEGRLLPAVPHVVTTARCFYAVMPEGAARRRSVRAFVDWIVQRANSRTAPDRASGCRVQHQHPGL